jgi:hypothetical protein
MKYVGAFKVVASCRYHDRYDHDVSALTSAAGGRATTPCCLPVSRATPGWTRSTTNDESVPGYTVFAAPAGYACKRGFGGLKKPFIRVNADNLLDKKYLGQIDGVSVSGPNYYYQGMPRSFFVAVGGTF